MSGSAAKLHGFSLPRNDSREYSSKDFPDFLNFFVHFKNEIFLSQEIIKDFFGAFCRFNDGTVNFKFQKLKTNISDKSKMSAEYVEQLIQKLDSLDLETEDKERIYLRKLEKSIIVIENSAWIPL